MKNRAKRKTGSVTEDATTITSRVLQLHLEP